MTLTSQDGSGSTFDVLRMHFATGELDLVQYVAPGLHLAPTNGSPAPVIVASSAKVTRGPVTSDHNTHQPNRVLTLTNTGTATLNGPVLVALTGLPAGVTVSGSASLVAGSPAVAASGGALAPGASVKFRVNFSDPTNIRFSYGTAVYAGL